MSGIHFSHIINDKMLTGERIEDVVVMIDIIAYERSMFIDAWLTEKVFEFAAGIICIIFEPLKPPPFEEKVSALRQQFIGISQLRELRLSFRELLTPRLLGAQDLRQAISFGFDDLFSGAMMGDFDSGSGSGSGSGSSSSGLKDSGESSIPEHEINPFGIPST